MIRVNGKEYDTTAVFATDGSMSMKFETNEKLDAIERDFPFECIIEVIEQGDVVAKYYNKNVMSLKIDNGDVRKVTVVFAVSEIQQSAEAKLNDRADTSDGAIEELAGLVAEQMGATEGLSEAITMLSKKFTELEMTVATLTNTSKEASNG